MQKMKSSVLSLSVLIPSALALHHLPFVCVSSPPLPLEAGTSNVTAVLEDPLNRRCEATIFFADPDFLPISYSFDSECSGRKVNSFRLPIGAPNGEAHVSWHCAGQAPSCTRAVITGGRGDPSLPLQNEGDVGCISQSVLTRTTLATVTRSSRTFVETVSTLITSITTDFEAAAATSPGASDTTPPGTMTTTGTITTQTAQGESPNETSLSTPAAATADTTLAAATNANGAGDGSSANPPPTSPESTSPSDPLETFFASSASGRTTSLTTTAAVTAAVSTLTIMQTVTASCSAEA